MFGKLLFFFHHSKIAISYKSRKKLNDQSANQLFSFLYGGDTLAKLGIKEIPANEINLTPYLLKK